MTIEELLEFDSAKLAKMTDKELDEYFKPFYNVTRPELAPKPAKGISSVRKLNSNDPQKQLAYAMLRSFGVDLSDV